MRIDSHQHFWHYNPDEHVWMTDELSVLKRSFMPADLEPLLQSVNFDGAIVVQARQMLKETEWLLDLADEYEIVKGVVGWVDLRSPEIGSQLERYAAHPKFSGVRHVVQDEPDDNFMLLPEFQRGITELKQYNLPYDLLIYPRHIPVAIELVKKFPEQPFVVDHIAKPVIKDKSFSPWQEDLKALAQFENVTCKLSGMVFEADWKNWEPSEFEPYMEIVIDAFGPNRLMIGSNWPVCTVAGDYQSVMNIVIDYIRQLSPTEQAQINGETCARFYQVS